MRGKHAFIFPAIFVAVMAPVLIVALITFRPNNESGSKDCPALPALHAPHTHSVGLASTVKNDLQLIFNVSPAAELYQVVDGRLELCGGDLSDEMKHVTLDVNDARLILGERLPVDVHLTIRQADTGAVVVQAAAPAMYSPGHGYHFGDNFLLAPGTRYDWTVTVGPVAALRQEGAQAVWLEPVEWSGSFDLGADGSVIDAAAGVQPVGDFVQGGLHVTLSQHDAVPLYEVTEAGATVPIPLEPGSRYVVVDVTDHAVNYEEKLPGALVTLTFRQGETAFDVVLDPVISPAYGFHYGANVALQPGAWQVTVRVEGLDFLRHAGAAVSLARGAISGTLTMTIE